MNLVLKTSFSLPHSLYNHGDGVLKLYPAMPQVVMENLFTLYPPAPPTVEERSLEQQQKAAAAAKLVRSIAPVGSATVVSDSARGSLPQLC